MASDSKKDKPQRNDFARKRQEWLGRVTMDGGLTAPAFRFAIANSQHFNRTKPGHPCWVSQETYAEKLGVSVSTFGRAMRDLRERGHFIRVIYRKQNSAICFPDLENVNGLQEYPLETRHAEDWSDLSPDPSELTHLENQDRSILHSRPVNSAFKTGQNCATNQSREPVDEPVDIYIPDSAGQIIAGEIIESGKTDSSNGGDFNQFWQAYPRKVGKAGALREYRLILKHKKATATELLDGAERYASYRAGKDPGFTLHPKTWLHNGHWADELEPDRANSAMDGIRSFLKDRGAI